jgi:hypothetical protein
MLRLLLYPEDGGSEILQNVGDDVSDFMAHMPVDSNLHGLCCKNVI